MLRGVSGPSLATGIVERDSDKEKSLIPPTSRDLASSRSHIRCFRSWLIRSEGMLTELELTQSVSTGKSSIASLARVKSENETDTKLCKVKIMSYVPA